MVGGGDGVSPEVLQGSGGQGRWAKGSVYMASALYVQGSPLARFCNVSF